MSRWAYKSFGFKKSFTRGSYSGSNYRSGNWAFSTPKRKGSYSKSWGYDSGRDRVYGYGKPRRRFLIW